MTTRKSRDLSFLGRLPVRDLFAAKCEDGKLGATPEREKRFQESLSKCCTATLLDLREQGLREKSATVMSSFLGSDEGFVNLALANNELGDRGVSALAGFLQHNMSLTSLDLRNNAVDPPGAQMLFEALEVNKGITAIDMSTSVGARRNTLGPQGCAALAAALCKNPVLSRLVLRDTMIGPVGAARLAGGLTANSSVSKLDLSSNGLKDEGCAVLCRALAKQASALEFLSLANNAIGNSGAQALGQLLACHQALEQLDISRNSVGPEGAGVLFGALKTNEQCALHMLNVELNPLEDGGVREVCLWVAKSKTLETLLLAKTGLKSGDAVAEAIKCCTSLRRLDLHGNSLAGASIDAICQVLGAVHRLKNFDVGSCAIGKEGGRALTGLVERNRSLQHLSIKDNKLDHDSCMAIALASQKNEKLLTLNIDMNDLAYLDHATLADRLKRNRAQWEKEAPLREAAELKKLREGHLELMDLERQLQEAAIRQRETGKKIEEATKSLEDTKGAAAKEIEELRRVLEEKVNHVKEVAERSGASSAAEIVAAKEKERKDLMDQITKDRGVIRMLGKKIGRVTLELKAQLAKFDAETHEMQRELNVAEFDRTHSSKQVENLQKQVEEAKATFVKLEEQTLLAATDKVERTSRKTLRPMSPAEPEHKPEPRPEPGREPPRLRATSGRRELLPAVVTVTSEDEPRDSPEHVVVEPTSFPALLSACSASAADFIRSTSGKPMTPVAEVNLTLDGYKPRPLLPSRSSRLSPLRPTSSLVVTSGPTLDDSAPLRSVTPTSIQSSTASLRARSASLTKIS